MNHNEPHFNYLQLPSAVLVQFIILYNIYNSQNSQSTHVETFTGLKGSPKGFKSLVSCPLLSHHGGPGHGRVTTYPRSRLRIHQEGYVWDVLFYELMFSVFFCLASLCFCLSFSDVWFSFSFVDLIIRCRSVARETQGDGNPPHSTPAPIAAIPRNHRISLLHCWCWKCILNCL